MESLGPQRPHARAVAIDEPVVRRHRGSVESGGTRRMCPLECRVHLPAAKQFQERRKRCSLTGCERGEASEHSHSVFSASQLTASPQSLLSLSWAGAVPCGFYKVPAPLRAYLRDDYEVEGKSVRDSRFEVAGRQLRAPPSFH